MLILQRICSMCIYEGALYLKNRKPLDRNAHLSLNIPIIASWRSFLKAPYLMSVEHHLLCWSLYILILSKSNFYEETSVSFNIEYKYSSITHRHLHHLCPPTPSSLSTLLLHLFPLLQLPNSFFFFLSFFVFFWDYNEVTTFISSLSPLQTLAYIPSCSLSTTGPKLPKERSKQLTYLSMKPMKYNSDQYGTITLKVEWWNTYLGSNQQLSKLHLRPTQQEGNYVWYWKPSWLLALVKSRLLEENLQDFTKPP